MTFFLESMQKKSTIPLKYEKPDDFDEFISHQETLSQQIKDELNRCMQFFMQNLQIIIKDWKTASLNNYRQIITTIDASLRGNINKIICEQIAIQKQDIKQIIKTMQESIVKLRKKVPDKDKKEKYEEDKTIIILKNKEKSQLLLKTRSISNDSNPRRRLSKGSFFAEAKKVVVQKNIGDCMVKTNPVVGFSNKVQKNGSKIKKTKRKEQNCFDTLQRCNNLTSPSNFMLNYVNARQILKNNDSNIAQRSKVTQCKKYFQNEKVDMKNENQDMAKPNVVQFAESPCVNDSQTYQNLMINFEQKITKKLDDLMIKYTKIQEKLQNSEQEKSQKYQLKQTQKLEKQKQNALSIEESINQQNNKTINSVQKQVIPSKVVANKQTIIQAKMVDITKNSNANDQTKIKKPVEKELFKKSVLSVQVNNKIIKNKTKVIQTFQDSLQQISLATQNPIKTKNDLNCNNGDSQINKQKAIEQEKYNEQAKAKQVVQENKKYYESLILQFYSITQKVLLPISKQLLFIIVDKYQTFCKNNSIVEKSKVIMSIETKKLQNIKKQYNQLLQKIEKVIDSKCQKAKKQKLLMYFQNFIQVVMSYEEQKNLITKYNQKLTESELKAKIKDLRIQLSQ